MKNSSIRIIYIISLILIFSCQNYIDYKEITAGQKYLIGEAEIEISFICEPCTNLYKLPYIGTQRGPEFMAAIMNRRGWYARVLKEGHISVGNSFVLQ